MTSAGIPTLTRRCSGSIAPSVFVAKAADPTQPGAVKTCGANGVVFGVSFQGTKQAPGLVAALGGTPGPDVAGNNGDPIPVYSTGDECLVFTATGFSDGDDLESDASGYAVTSAAAGHNVGAVALETVPANCFGMVRVTPHAVH